MAAAQRYFGKSTLTQPNHFENHGLLLVFGRVVGLLLVFMQLATW